MAQTDDKKLPDWFAPVAQDVLDYCPRTDGLWVDLGSGSGGLGLALARASGSAVLLIDPNADSLGRCLQTAQSEQLAARVAPIVGRAEAIPLPDTSVDLVASRGSIFYWDDPPQGLREVDRVLRSGARAMIGGGFGTSYPQWAYDAFMQRMDASMAADGPEAVRKWNEPRRIEWLTDQARAAGLGDRLIQPIPPGRWLLWQKDED